MLQGTLRVPASERDAERPRLYSHAERGNDQGARVTWSGRFEPVGVSDEEVVALFTGIYQGGLEALRANYPA